MRVEAGGDDEKVGFELPKAREDDGLEGLAEGVAAIAGREWRIDYGIVFAALSDRSGPG